MVLMRPPTPRREHMLLTRVSISVRVAWPTPRSAAAGAPGGPRVHSARNAHTARQRSPPDPPAHM
eukprot:2862666-Prymnesium_polylepis.1